MLIKQPKIKIKLYDEEFDCYLRIDRYRSNDRLYLRLETKDSLFTDITINLAGFSLFDEDTIFVNGNMTNEVKKQLKEYGILSNHLYSVKYNMGNYDCYSINLDKLKYYDPQGFKEFGLKLDEVKDQNYDIKI